MQRFRAIDPADIDDWSEKPVALLLVNVIRRAVCDAMAGDQEAADWLDAQGFGNRPYRDRRGNGPAMIHQG